MGFLLFLFEDGIKLLCNFEKMRIPQITPKVGLFLLGLFFSISMSYRNYCKKPPYHEGPTFWWATCVVNVKSTLDW